jgi:hypothetical protein
VRIVAVLARIREGARLRAKRYRERKRHGDFFVELDGKWLADMESLGLLAAGRREPEAIGAAISRLLTAGVRALKGY